MVVLLFIQIIQFTRKNKNENPNKFYCLENNVIKFIETILNKFDKS